MLTLHPIPCLLIFLNKGQQFVNCSAGIPHSVNSFILYILLFIFIFIVFMKYNDLICAYVTNLKEKIFIMIKRAIKQCVLSLLGWAFPVNHAPSPLVKCTKYIVLGDYCVRGHACLVVVRLIKVKLLCLTF